MRFAPRRYAPKRSASERFALKRFVSCRPRASEKRLFRYAKVGPELLEMTDEGLVLAARAKARLGQSLSAAQHTEGHLQVVGVGNWKPTGTRPAWNAEPRLTEEDS